MPKRKTVRYYNGRLQGSLTEEQCNQLETVLKLKDGMHLKRNGKSENAISTLKHTIYNLEDELIDAVIDDHQSLSIGERPIGTLTDGQTISLGFSYIAGNCIIGDSVGLGKTVEISALINLLKKEKYDKYGQVLPFRYLFLTEKSLMSQAQRELIRFTGEYTEILEGTKAKVSKFRQQYPQGFDYGLVAPHSIINQNEFHAWLNDMRGTDKDYQYFDLIIIDESSILGHSKTQTYKNALKLREHTNKVILLNASAFESNLEYMFGQLNFVDEEFMPTLSEFKKKYFVYDYSGAYGRPMFKGQYKNEEDFKYSVAYRYFFMTREHLGAKIEDVYARILTVPLSTEQETLLKESSMPRMVFDAPSAINPEIPANEYTTPKLQLLRDLVLGAGIEQGEQVLISAIYKESQQIIKDFVADLGYSSAILNGDVQKERYDIIEQFKSNKLPILITNVQKGLNFGNVRNIIFYGYDPNPNKMIQMEGRITRSFDIKNKNVYLLSTQGKELKKIQDTVAKRYQYSTKFSSKDISGIGQLLLDSVL